MQTTLTSEQLAQIQAAVALKRNSAEDAMRVLAFSHTATFGEAKQKFDALTELHNLLAGSTSITVHHA